MAPGPVAEQVASRGRRPGDAVAVMGRGDQSHWCPRPRGQHLPAGAEPPTSDPPVASSSSVPSSAPPPGAAHCLVAEVLGPARSLVRSLAAGETPGATTRRGDGHQDSQRPTEGRGLAPPDLPPGRGAGALGEPLAPAPPDLRPNLPTLVTKIKSGRCEVPAPKRQTWAEERWKAPAPPARATAAPETVTFPPGPSVIPAAAAGAAGPSCSGEGAARCPPGWRRRPLLLRPSRRRTRAGAAGRAGAGRGGQAGRSADAPQPGPAGTRGRAACRQPPPPPPGLPEAAPGELWAQDRRPGTEGRREPRPPPPRAAPRGLPGRAGQLPSRRGQPPAAEPAACQSGGPGPPTACHHPGQLSLGGRSPALGAQDGPSGRPRGDSGVRRGSCWWQLPRYPASFLLSSAQGTHRAAGDPPGPSSRSTRVSGLESLPAPGCSRLGQHPGDPVGLRRWASGQKALLPPHPRRRAAIVALGGMGPPLPPRQAAHGYPRQGSAQGPPCDLPKQDPPGTLPDVPRCAQDVPRQPAPPKPQ
ncbi:basic salivary proline-rich protein 1-like [Canis lupus familiaris]|uniref:basic salivary proline-rich protein 1-like n=1 Tax=Canis lupus familiaris TaxID=9615 RepID=UPI0018F58BD5|nr:basic salivary proline-rich protein 1-like [Canis lupus familiaris]